MSGGDDDIGMPAGAPIQPWADLEPGIISMIADCCALKDYASCRGVCAAWRSALPPPLSRPLAVLPADDAASLPVSLAACPLYARRWSRLQLHRPGGRVGAAARCRCVGASRDGWVALVAGDAMVPAGPILFNPFTGEEIPLDESLYQPALGQLEPKIVFSPNPTRHDFIAASLIRPDMVAVQRAADDGCSYSEDTGPFLDGVVLVDIAYGDDEKVYCLALDGEVHVLHLTRRHRVGRKMPPMEVGTLQKLPIGPDAFPPPYDAISKHTDIKNLVLCEGGLYQVWRRPSGSGSATIDAPSGEAARPIRIFEGAVFILKYDPGNRPGYCWAVADAKDLRGNAVFVGMNDAAVVRGEGVSANSIYYWDGPREGDGDYEPVVYNVATGASMRWPVASTVSCGCPVWYFLPAADVRQRAAVETADVGATSWEEPTSLEPDDNSAHRLKKTMKLVGRLDYSVVYDSGLCEVGES